MADTRCSGSRGLNDCSESAINLSRAGIHVEVFEKAGKFGEVGSGVGLGNEIQNRMFSCNIEY